LFAGAVSDSFFCLVHSGAHADNLPMVRRTLIIIAILAGIILIVRQSRSTSPTTVAPKQTAQP
jgi:hypothetical protein